MKSIFAVLFALAVSAPLAGQTARPAPARRPPPAASTEPLISIRPFVMATEQQFAAEQTFKAVFDRSNQPFFGGGAQIVFRHGLYAELTASRFKKTGERAFLSNGESFRLGIPLAATITAFEVSGGYRFHFTRHPRIIPYAGAGAGTYAYKETSEFSDAAENLDTRHSGYLAAAGVEIRLHRWIGVDVDAQYTRVLGILGDGGLSKDAGEKDLGGIAARVKLVVGR